MRWIIGLWVFFISLVFGSAGHALTIDNPELWTIVIAEDAIPSERYAAEEFQRLMREATGAEMDIATSAPTRRRNVYLVPATELGDEGLGIRIARRSITITGGRPRGVLYGVYEFFEQYMGVRFLTHDHTHVPEATLPIKLPNGYDQFIPDFEFRWSYYRENTVHPEFAARLRVNTVPKDEKFGGVTPQSLINHTLHHWLPVAKYGADHPEYYALVDGERKLEMHGGGPEPCVTNPEVIEIVANAVIADLNARPDQRNISVSQNDNDAYCQCDNCEAINKREGTPMGSHLAFVNAVAERVVAVHPDVKVGTLAYWYTRKPPKTIRPHPSLQIQLCSIECCTLHAINDPDCEKNREFCADLQEWKKMSDDIWIWNYNTNFANYDLPFPNLRSISPNVQFFKENNVHGLFMQANGNGLSGEMSDLRNYVMARTIWNPALDSWELVEEFCRLHYAESAEPILAYLTMLHDNAEARNVHPSCFPTAGEVGLDHEVALAALGYFDNAMKMATSDVVRDRVEKASICAYKALLTTSNASKYADGRCALNVPEDYANLIPDYIALVRKHNVERSRETQSMEEFIGQIEQWTAGVPATRIENDVWRVTVLPTKNGRMAELLHKPSGRDLVYPRGRVITRHRSFEEWGYQGFDPNILFTFEASIENNGIVMRGTIKEGARMERRIALDGDAVRFSTTLTHEGDDERTYQIWVHPEFDAATTSSSSDVLQVFVRDEKWVQVNEGWRVDSGPQEDLLRTAKGGSFAYFNTEESFGAAMHYDHSVIERPKLWWGPGRGQVNLELYTNAVKLKPGASTQYGYTLTYLDAAPKP